MGSAQQQRECNTQSCCEPPSASVFFLLTSIRHTNSPTTAVSGSGVLVLANCLPQSSLYSTVYDAYSFHWAGWKKHFQVACVSDFIHCTCVLLQGGVYTIKHLPESVATMKGRHLLWVFYDSLVRLILRYMCMYCVCMHTSILSLEMHSL